MMAAYYNEIDPYAAQWLRNLIAAGHIADGDVDERSIIDVRPDDLRSYHQCHFFAGIAGWSLALRVAGWPDDRPVWTGSCPCQPFSAPGTGKAADDERHLWPAWFTLIQERRPAIVFGEQVEAAIGWGWLDVVFADLEASGYACGATVLPACSIGAPHIRNRIWFVADANSSRCGEGRPSQAGNGRDTTRIEPTGLCVTGELGNANESGLQARQRSKVQRGPGATAVARGFAWDCEWLPCTDGKARPIEPSTFPLAYGVSKRMGRLRAYGNAIVPQVAAEFITANME